MLILRYFYPPGSKSSRDVANLTERKNLHTSVYGVKEFESVCLLPLFDLSSNKNQKPFQKKFATLAASAVFVSLFFLQNQLIYDFLARNNNPDSPLSQGGMKFATQISPLLNLCKPISFPFH